MKERIEKVLTTKPGRRTRKRIAELTGLSERDVLKALVRRSGPAWAKIVDVLAGKNEEL